MADYLLSGLTHALENLSFAAPIGPVAWPVNRANVKIYLSRPLPQDANPENLDAGEALEAGIALCRRRSRFSRLSRAILTTAKTAGLCPLKEHDQE